MDQTRDTTRRAWQAVERGAIVLVLLLVAALAGLSWVRRGGWRDRPAAGPASQPAGAYLNKIDPNTANWQTLECIPGIGETRAKAIVEYRKHSKRQPAFTQPEDLLHVKGPDGKYRGIPGIAEKTLEKLEPFLAFPTTQTER